MIYKEFLETQNKIYSEFEDCIDKAKKNNLVLPAKKVINRRGILCILTFGVEVKIILEQAKEIFVNTPYYFHKLEKLHSTISISNKLPIKLNPSNIKNIVQQFEQKRPQIEFRPRKILFNQDSIILACDTNQIYWQVCSKIVEELNKETELSFRYPKMAHITLARTGNISVSVVSKAKVAEIQDKLANISLPSKFSPNSIQVGLLSVVEDVESFEVF